MSLRSLDPSLWHELSNHLDRALDLEPAECEQWLNGLAANQPVIATALRNQRADEASTNAVKHLSQTVEEEHPLLLQARDFARNPHNAQRRLTPPPPPGQKR
jgi:hypothetical protein